MTDTQVLSVSAHTIFLILLLSAPMLVSSLIVGLIISILQATTQIQEQTLSFVPKIVTVFLAMLIFGTWMASLMTHFCRRIFDQIANIALR